MKAAWYAKNGPAGEVLEVGELAKPSVKAGEVLVRIRASGINPVDTKWRSGLKPVAEGMRMVPHFDGAGTIEGVGDGVPKSRIGERVWIYETLWQRDATGTAAEYASVPSGLAVPLSERVDFAEAACLGIPAMTAHRCVFADGPVEGQTVLVTGGGGAVSGFAIQMARLGGARVIATASNDAKADVARSAGAEQVIDYKSADAAAQIKQAAGPGGVHRIVEVALAANFAMSADVIANNGVIAAYASDANPEPKLPFRALLYKNVALRHVLVFGMPAEAKAKAIADIGQWTAAGKLKSRIGERFPLDRIADAHLAVERGATGKIVLDI
jgi:NADPH2:quinone reductase